MLWVGKERRIKTLLGFFRWFGAERSAALKFACSDMWTPYLKVIAKKAVRAVQVLDRFHIMAHLSKAIDEVRAGEVEALKAGGYEPVLKDSRRLLLKRPERLSEKQEIRLAELLQYKLKNVRAYLLKEVFQFFRAKGAISSGIVEGFNKRAKPSIRKAYGFRTLHGMEIALFHAVGALPEPKGTHRFC